MSVNSIASLAVPQPSTNTPSAASAKGFLHAYFKERRPEIQELNAALKSGDVTAAEQAYNNLVALGNQVLGKSNPFLRSDRALDFDAIGGALQNGDLAGAQAAFAALQNTFVKQDPPSPTASTVSPHAVVSLSNSSA